MIVMKFSTLNTAAVLEGNSSTLMKCMDKL
jgi:hypothetical protein